MDDAILSVIKTPDGVKVQFQDNLPDEEAVPAVGCAAACAAVKVSENRRDALRVLLFLVNMAEDMIDRYYGAEEEADDDHS